MDLNKKIDINLGITIILIFAAILVIIDFYYIGSQLDGYPFDDVAGGPIIIDINSNVGDADTGISIENIDYDEQMFDVLDLEPIE